MTRVEFVTREGCTLCDAGRAKVARVAALLRIDVVDVDVDGDPLLRDELGGRVPVVRDATGAVVAEGRFTTGAVAAALLRLKLAGDGGPAGHH